MKCMAALTFDTLKFAERLKSGGMPPAQAIAEAEALRDVLSEALDTTVATKTDIGDVKSEIRSVRTEISRLDAKLEAKFAQLESKIDLKFGLVDAKFDKINWMLGVIIALATASFARQFL